ncbi:MAG: prepilin-type N-terminal cleavage/methylation domain-containing protein [Okeania sp. SIO1H6]|nr:prepilin-type N-terminal cleavage/methylation domain-containing protein [Okeania sp. SIO1H6]
MTFSIGGMMNILDIKFLQYLSNRNNHHGFTLIELLVVMMIMGILSAIALAAFLNLVTKAKQLEAITYVDSTTDEQVSNYIEYNQFKNQLNKFTSFPQKAKINNDNPLLENFGFLHKTENYYYGIPLTNNEIAVQMALNYNSTLKSFAGIVYVKNGKLLTMKCEAYLKEFVSKIFPKLSSISLEDIEQELQEYCD